MRFKTVLVEEYGVQVYQHPEMDELRRIQCLCLNCSFMYHCKIAQKGYKLCKEYNVAYAMTRCPNWRKKELI